MGWWTYGTKGDRTDSAYEDEEELLGPLIVHCVFVSAREHIVGWYHTGPKLNPNDLAVHKLVGNFCANPVS